MKPLLQLLCLASVWAWSSAQSTPASCAQSDSMQFDATQLNGTWWEVARNPSPTGNWDCVEVDFYAMPQNVLQINITYSNTPSFLWVNQTMYASITVDNSTTSGYNVSYVNGLTDTPYTLFKLLATDYTHYAFVCGYTNVSDGSTYFGAVLTRERYPSDAVLTAFETLAALSYANFSNTSMAMITQSPTCYAASASAVLPAMLALLVLFFTALMHVHG